MALELNGTTGVSLVQDGVVTAADLASGAITAAALPAGSVIQVVSTLKTDTWSQSVTARLYSGDVTGLTATITPRSASNKLLVIASVQAANSSTPYRVGGGIFRDGSFSAFIGDAASSRTRTTWGRVDTLSSTLSHSSFSFAGVTAAGSTSATTFSIRILQNEGTDGTVYVNRASEDIDVNYVTQSASSIIVMEIAA